MAIVGAAPNGYTLDIASVWYSIADSFWCVVLALFAKVIIEKMPDKSVPANQAINARLSSVMCLDGEYYAADTRRTAAAEPFCRAVT